MYLVLVQVRYLVVQHSTREFFLRRLLANNEFVYRVPVVQNKETHSATDQFQCITVHDGALFNHEWAKYDPDVLKMHAP